MVGTDPDARSSSLKTLSRRHLSKGQRAMAVAKGRLLSGQLQPFDTYSQNGLVSEFG
jgi:hypothetical protein